MGHSIAFAQLKGGTGKTTILAHLAHSWAHHGKNVGLIDLDLRGELTKWFETHREVHLNLKESRIWRAGPDIERSEKRHDITLVDCPSDADVQLHVTIRKCDLTLIPCQPTGMDVRAALAILEIAKFENKPAFVVMNRVPPHGKHTAESIATLQAQGARVLKSQLGNRVAFSSGMLDGYTAMSGGRKTSARDEVENLRKELDLVLETL